mmetsp:Transcript_57577/g.135494  ORF Transcript_57577/g.135494 Transcript_57577/m.135494 type:complete len:334 (-) Transcript_57577:463-1464(-)
MICPSEQSTYWYRVSFWRPQPSESRSLQRCRSASKRGLLHLKRCSAPSESNSSSIWRWEKSVMPSMYSFVRSWTALAPPPKPMSANGSPPAMSHTRTVPSMHADARHLSSGLKARLVMYAQCPASTVSSPSTTSPSWSLTSHTRTRGLSPPPEARRSGRLDANLTHVTAQSWAMLKVSSERERASQSRSALSCEAVARYLPSDENEMAVYGRREGREPSVEALPSVVEINVASPVPHATATSVLRGWAESPEIGSEYPAISVTGSSCSPALECSFHTCVEREGEKRGKGGGMSALVARACRSASTGGGTGISSSSSSSSSTIHLDRFRFFPGI